MKLNTIINRIWDSIPRHLAKENKKFVFSAVKKGARGRDYENALTWIEDAGLVHRAYAVESAKHPLKHYADTSCFKKDAKICNLPLYGVSRLTDLIAKDTELDYL